MASEVLAPALTSGSDDRDDVTAVGTPARRDSNSTGSVPRKGSDDVTANKDAPARPQQPQRQSTMVRWARAVLVADLAPYYDTDAETMGDLVRRLTRAGTFNAGNLPAEADPNSDSFSLESLIKLFIQKERVRLTLCAGRRADCPQEAGWEKRTLGVSFEHLTVTGRGSGVNFGSDVGSFLTKPVDLVRRIASGQLRQPTKVRLITRPRSAHGFRRSCMTSRVRPRPFPWGAHVCRIGPAWRDAARSRSTGIRLHVAAEVSGQ